MSLQDTLEGLNRIEEFISGMDLAMFRADPKTVAAVERKLLQIAEAATRMGDDAVAVCAEIPWRDIRGRETGCAVVTTASMLKSCGTQ